MWLSQGIFFDKNIPFLEGYLLPFETDGSINVRDGLGLVVIAQKVGGIYAQGSQFGQGNICDLSVRDGFAGRNHYKKQNIN